VAAEALASGKPARRGKLQLAGSLTCYRPYRCADGYVTLGALEPKFWAAFCHGVGREDLVAHQFDPPGSEAHREVSEIFAGRTREQWRAFASEYDCCLEPVLDLDDALQSELVAAREMVVELDQPGAQRPVKLLGVPVKLSRTPGDPTRAPGPALGEHTDEVLAEAGFSLDQIEELHDQGAVAGPSTTVQGSFLRG
jgi:crotonobetainyl-CoA:carnitine CoA-transferase CaiB-like acyl-CoA transferase